MDLLTAWDVAEINPSWFSGILRKDVVRVEEVDFETTMSLGNLRKIQVIFSDGSAEQYVLKTESLSGPANKFAAMLKCFVTEHSFYSSLRQHCKARIPRALYSSVSSSGEAMTLILEHITGSVGSSGLEPLPLESVRSAAIELGRFHGSFVGKTEEISTVKSVVEHLSGTNPQSAIDFFLETWGSTLDEFKDPAGGNVVRAVFQHCAANQQNWASLLEMGQPSLIHGDYKATNVIFSREGLVPSTTILDFQTLYRGGYT